MAVRLIAVAALAALTAGCFQPMYAERNDGKPGLREVIADMEQQGEEVPEGILDAVITATIAPIITKTVSPGTLIYTDEYDIYARLEDWGYAHKSVCHAWGEYARDDDGDGFCEVHVNTIEGFWSLLRSWLRPHRGAVGI